jgi:hypothetical protein
MLHTGASQVIVLDTHVIPGLMHPRPDPMGLAWMDSLDAAGNLFFMEMKGRADGADSVTRAINDVNGGCNSPPRLRLALVMVEGDRASQPVYVIGVDSGLPGVGGSQITKNLQQMLAARRAPHRPTLAC